MPSERTVTKDVAVEAGAPLIFEVLTQQGHLRDWFCDLAWSDPRPGGRCALHWGQGYHVEGRFLEVDPPRRAAIAWQGTGEPGETRVAVELEEREGRVSVRVVHSGFGPGSEWDAAVAQSERGWETGLENLQSTLETGIDLRLARQPFLGINLDLLTPERAAREGIAAQWGIYVEGVVEGSGAQAAGIHPGDVIVSLGGLPTNRFEELNISDAQRAELRSWFFLEPLPFVRRVVFIATPHRGSYLSGGLARRLAQVPWAIRVALVLEKLRR